MENTEVYCGEVCWFSKGYGFISWVKDNVPQKDIFIHYTDIDCDGFKILHKSDKVSFELGENKHGALKAIKVKVLK